MSSFNPEKPWLARVLIPFWIVQLAICAILFILSAWALSIVDSIDHATARHYLALGAVILIIFTIISFALNVLEMIAYSRRKMHPLLYLVTNCIKTTAWLVYFIISVISDTVTNRSWDIIISTIFLAVFLATLIYASITFRRYRLSTKYNQLNPHQQYKSYNYPPGAHSPWSTETAYDPHRDQMSDHDEMHYYDRTSSTKPSPYVAVEELDHDAASAMDPAYKKGVTVTEHYEPLRRDVFEMETGYPQRHSSDEVSPLTADVQATNRMASPPPTYFAGFTPLSGRGRSEGGLPREQGSGLDRLIRVAGRG